MKMTRPTECKHCGLHGVWDIDDDTFFACGTSWCGRVDIWNQSTGCVEIVQSRERIKRAVEVLEGAERFDVDRAIEILEGEEDDDINSSKSSNSSPITTDDLAAADYFEAVRQRVPWMVAVKHIEGLVEGYRRCGVAVWQTAKEIRKVHGGEYGKAE